MKKVLVYGIIIAAIAVVVMTGVHFMPTENMALDPKPGG
jgi:t-SNARE complex subunit (syntaxin)